MNQVSIEGLLEKNPGAREIFEENAKKLGSHRDINRKRSSYGLGLPYGGKKLRRDDQTDKKPPAVASYQRY